MSRLNANIGDAYYSVKKWLGVNENPDGDTNLKNGEGAAMRNFRITDGGALRKRPGSETVAGLLSGYSTSTGAEEITASETGDSSRTLTVYPGIALDSVGQIHLTGEGVELNYANSNTLVGYYYKDSDGKVWQHSGVSLGYNGDIQDGDILVDGGYVRMGTSGYYSVYPSTWPNQGNPEYCDRWLRCWDGIKIVDGKLVGDGNYTDVIYHSSSPGWQEQVGKYFQYVYVSSAHAFQGYGPGDGYGTFYDIAGRMDGVEMDVDWGGDRPIYTPITVVATPRYDWHAAPINIVVKNVGYYMPVYGAEKVVFSEDYAEKQNITVYPGVSVGDDGSISFAGEGAEINRDNHSMYAGYCYADANGKFWRHTNCTMIPASGDVILGSSALTLAEGYVEDLDTVSTRLGGWITLYSAITVENGEIVLSGETHFNYDNAYQMSGALPAWYKDDSGNVYYAEYQGEDLYSYAGTIYTDYFIKGRAVTGISVDKWEWSGEPVSAEFCTAGNPVQGLWSGTVKGAEYIVAACNGRLWSLSEDGGVWSKEAIGIVDTNERVCLFGFGGNLYCLTGADYHKWDGEVFSRVAGYTPVVLTASTPTTGGGTTLDRVNLLTAKRRQRYNADGKSTVYQLAETGLASIDAVEVDGAAATNYTVDAEAGTVTFATAPAEGVDNVEIWYTASEDYRSKVTAMRFAEFYNGVTDSRVFLYGDGSNVALYSDITEDGQASAEYFPDLNKIAIGDSNSPITGMIRQYSRLMAFKRGGSAWSIYYDSITLADGQVTAGFYCSPVNRNIGNDAMGQAVLVENLPRTVDGRSIYEWKSSSGGYITNDQRNAQRVSQKVENSLRSFDLQNCLMFFDKIAHEFYCVYNGTAVVQNTESGAWYIYTDFPAVALIVHKDELYYGTDDGNLRRFSEDYTGDNGKPIDAYWESGSMSFDRDYVLKYSPTVWAGLKQEDNAAVEIGIETDVQEPIYGAITVEGGAEAMPSMKRVRLKAQKFTYYKLLFRSRTADTKATVVAADVRVKYNIKVK